MFNRFFAFEGVDGSGKTTIVKAVADVLISLGFRVIVVREPGGLGISEHVRSLLLDGFPNTDEVPTDDTRALLFNVSRSEQVAKIILPKLKEGYIVLADRFCDSTLVYQGYCNGKENKEKEINQLIQLHDLVIKINPKTTFYIDVDAETAFKRTMSRGDLNILDARSVEKTFERIMGYVRVMGLKRHVTEYISVDNTNPEIEIAVNEIVSRIEKTATTSNLEDCYEMDEFLKRLEFMVVSRKEQNTLVDPIYLREEDNSKLQKLLFNESGTPNMDNINTLIGMGNELHLSRDCELGRLVVGGSYIQLACGRIIF